MFNIFKKAQFKIVSPAKGKLKDITEVNDKTFSTKTLGDGFAIEPENGDVHSPMDGVVESIFPTLHALALKNSNGTEILIHIGINTVTLNGDGFKSFVSEGKKVNAGDRLVTFDMDFVKDKVKSTDIIVIFMNGQSCELLKNGADVEVSEEEIVNIK
ncbi:phosphotransferase system sugar-specific permease eiia type 1 [Lucifera butyrica]|uniref:Phosphotransferase system sugar-specific permease eiia type 1 n=2 Tax=Lucifera butyrica TaxID=1351585 RepID=A0A498RD29_9FIRM|nr:phosphotransferase system sugar-specific permease eiia type 1 [Lucifera butyrica]